MTNNPTIDGVSRCTREAGCACNKWNQRYCFHWKIFARTDGLSPVVTVLSSRAGNDTSTIDQALPDGTKLYTAPPEVAALQSTIAQLQARIAELESGRGEPFQSRVQPWMLDCFGPIIAGDREERNHRFLEEALELVQACGASANEAHQLVDYVYGRPVGEPTQEVGGVMVTLAALCLANGLDMHANGETELARIWTKVEQIRAKQAAKPAISPLPGVYADRAPPAPIAVVQFANELISAAFDGGSFDGGEIQDMAVKHGLMRIEQRTKECGEACACREYGFPAECYRKNACLDATAALNEVRK